jgi:hypothetical protein
MIGIARNNRKKVKMNWLKRKLRAWLLDENHLSERAISVDHVGNIESESILNFRIYAANNGRIIEFHKYDRSKDKTDRSLYIVDKEQDVGEYVAKVISLELLR